METIVENISVDAFRHSVPELPTMFITGVIRAWYDGKTKDLVRWEELRDALSDGQLFSKLWLAKRLEWLVEQHPTKNAIVIVGGWHGFLARLLTTGTHALIWIERIVTYDLDPRCEKVARVINQELPDVIFAETGDANSYSYDRYPGAIIVNTSAEHMKFDWVSRVPQGELLVVQSTDARQYEGHVNCVDSADELAQQLSLSKVFYKGTLKLPKYNRFMVIGQK